MRIIQNKIIFVLACIVAFFVSQGMGSRYLFAGDDDFLKDKDKLISLAMEKTKERGLKWDGEYDVRLYRENEFIVVDFSRKQVSKDYLIAGGGRKIYFKHENEKYEYIKTFIEQ